MKKQSTEVPSPLCLGEVLRALLSHPSACNTKGSTPRIIPCEPLKRCFRAGITISRKIRSPIIEITVSPHALYAIRQMSGTDELTFTEESEYHVFSLRIGDDGGRYHFARILTTTLRGLLEKILSERLGITVEINPGNFANTLLRDMEDLAA